MSCPRCRSESIAKRRRPTSLGYRIYLCNSCRRQFNERTGTPFNDLQFPTDIVLMAVLWRLRYKLGFRNVAELLLQRGFVVSHETIRTWCYLYRAIDRDGNLLDSMLSEPRDKHAARRFLRRLIETAGNKPLRVTTDKHPAYTKAIRWIIGRKALHRHNRYLNNRMRQDHRHIKQRYYPMLGFKRFESASRFCTAFDELRNYLRVKRSERKLATALDRRNIFKTKWSTLMAELSA